MSAPIAVDFRDRQLRRDIADLHRAGWRPLYELLAELGRSRLCRTEIEMLARRYARQLDPKILAALGADRVPP